MAVEAYALTSLTSLKTHLGISTSTHDTLLETLIDAASDWIENECGGRRFFETTYTQELYDGDHDHTGRRWLQLKNFPITSTEAFVAQYKTGSNSSPTWTSFTVDEFEKYDDSGRVYFTGGLRPGRLNIRVTYSAGYASIPHDLAHAANKLAAKAYNRRKSEGTLEEEVGTARIQWAGMMDTELMNILSRYKDPQFL